MISWPKLKESVYEHKPIQWKKFFLVFLSFIVFSIVLKTLFHSIAVDYYEIKNIATEDIDFTDIYYYDQLDDKKSFASKDIVIVNIGSLPNGSLRESLVTIVPNLLELEPKVIGLDIFFAEQSTNIKNDSVLNSHLNNKKIVVGIERDNSPYFPTTKNSDLNFGYINLPIKDDETVREYYNYYTIKNHFKTKTNCPSETINQQTNGCTDDSIKVLSFARKIAQLYKSINNNNIEQTSYLKYSCIGNGFYNALDPNETENYKDNKFAAIESTEFLTRPSHLKHLIKDKIVILGWLGAGSMHNPNDITDKHRVPVNFKLFNRTPTMPGVVINANAVQMLTSDHKIIKEIEGWRYYLLDYCFIFIYLLMFMLIDNFRSLLLTLCVEIIFILAGLYGIIHFSLYLMNIGYHIKLTHILIDIALLIEFKIFAFHFYKKLEKKEFNLLSRFFKPFKLKKNE